MIAELPHVLGHPGTASRDDARVSKGAQVLRGIETEGGGNTERARAASAPLGANRLRGIFHDGDSKLLRMFRDYPVEPFHVGALSVKMHGKNGANICGL